MARRAMASLLFLIHPPSSMDCHEPVVGLEDDARAMSRPTPPRPRWICNRHRTQRPPSFRERRGRHQGWERSPLSPDGRRSNPRRLYVTELGYENAVGRVVMPDMIRQQGESSGFHAGIAHGEPKGRVSRGATAQATPARSHRGPQRRSRCAVRPSRATSLRSAARCAERRSNRVSFIPARFPLQRSAKPQPVFTR